LCGLVVPLRAEDPAHKPIPAETVAAYEKIGAKHVGFRIGADGFYVFRPQMAPSPKDLPGFALYPPARVKGKVQNDPELPQVDVPFGLDLTATHVTDKGLAAIKGLKHLTALSLGAKQITDAGLTELRGLTNLTTLDLSSTKIEDAGLKELKPLKNLTSLNLMLTQVTDAGLMQLSEYNNLRALNLGHTGVTDAGGRRTSGPRKPHAPEPVQDAGYGRRPQGAQAAQVAQRRADEGDGGRGKTAQRVQRALPPATRPPGDGRRIEGPGRPQDA
jgi:hypothetical protein